MIASSDAESAQSRIAELDWWHTIEVAPGVVTAGGWDLRATADAVPCKLGVRGRSAAVRARPLTI
jgi:hypothetical protein